MKDPKDILLSAMLPIDRLDDDDDVTQGEIVEDAIVQYEFIDLIENIGRKEFKETYLNFIDDIRKQSFNNQQRLCYHIIGKVQEVYNFEFPEKISILSILDIENIYNFIEFLEYDNINFLVEILKGFNIDFLKTNPYEFCRLNQDEILRQIDFYNKINLPLIFLNLYKTLENDILINIIISMISKNKGLITNELKIKGL